MQLAHKKNLKLTMELTFVSITNQDLKQGKGRKKTLVYMYMHRSLSALRLIHVKQVIRKQTFKPGFTSSRNNQGSHSSRQQHL